MQGEDEKHRRASVSQTIVNGTIGAPAVFSILLILCAFMLGLVLEKIESVQETLRKSNTELRILQVHMENTNAILIRAGIKKPDDDEGAGPTQPKR